ncbi:ankyrin repeats (3 copies) domain-containing protein [Trichoderma breve]|uniref:Ankyrin repeats (3 copies) domain-containing protein n=1 Tax=Trichoderma breve TaxID=2034170 RepID=A0A9W9E4D7_9HYPO|nr:ankyrin repeats (3 copies) domain-containing protein [Trichoderma breve]KAJ4856910.1 ankyrin repeats (3 copies) domain-containing protein [Trichoderma breve]
MAARTLVIFLYFLFFRCVLADDGDDFSNNLFTDLGPLLALFGERVTMQFLSQAMGISDCIILSMAPLGIVTTIVAAIRVGGPSWLKALIGRATENLAAAELELMSSSSNEVCELWNGRDVVRCAGSAPVWEFICLLPRTGLPKNPKVKIMSLEDAENDPYFYIKRLRRNERTFSDKMRALFGVHRQGGSAEDGIKENSNTQSDEVVIIRNLKHDVPNISHNRHRNSGRGELHLAACFGILLQIGFILYCSFIAQYSKLKSHFQKDDHAVASYAFPMTIIGSVVLSIGMFICSHVVESSTMEETFQPAEHWRARLVWLQQEKTVGDEEFKSFALYTGEDQPNIITSSRADHGKDSDEKQQQGSEGLKDFTITTVVGTVISLVGYVAQFIGFRGMHWSVSVASLIAVLTMAAVRAWIRRGLAKPMFCHGLLPGFELDWFADSLRTVGNAPWYNDLDGSSQEENTSSLSRRSTSTNQEKLAKSDDQSTTKEPLICEAQDYTTMRQSLAKLADWRGPASQEAIAVSLAIEATMNLLDDNLGLEDFSWGYKIQDASLNEQELKFRVIKQPDGKWKAHAGEIEAALSLRLFYIKSQQETQLLAKAIHKSGNPLDDDKWLRVKGEMPDMGLRILGPNTMQLYRHLDWWIPTDGPEILKGEAVYNPAEIDQNIDSGKHQINTFGSIVPGSTKFELDESRVVGLDPRHQFKVATGSHTQLSHLYYQNSQVGKWNFSISEGEGENSNDILCIQSLDSLEILYAKDMFSTFMWAVVESLERPMGGKTYIKTSQAKLENKDSWRRLGLENDDISRLAAAIQSTGLCNTHDAHISVITPLSIQRKLPEVDSIVEMVRNYTEPLEALHLWADAGQVYLQLCEHLNAFAVGSYTYIRAVAVLATFRKTLQEMIRREMTGVYESRFEEQLTKAMEIVDAEFQDHLGSLCELQDTDKWQKCYPNAERFFLLQDQESIISNSFDVYKEMDRQHLSRPDKDGAREKDIFDRTFLHYCAAFTYHRERWYEKNNYPDGSEQFLQKMRRWIEQGVDINARDIRGWTPLHYACCCAGKASTQVVQLLLEKGASVDVQGREGTAPIHCAARAGNLEMVEMLLEFGANIDIADGYGNTALHEAALNRSADIFETLCKRGCQKRRNKHGRAAFHIAAMKGLSSAVSQLGDYANSKDSQKKSPLYLAVEYGHKDFVQQLLRLPQVEVNARGYRDLTPLQVACKKGYDSITEILLDAGADIEILSDDGRTPLLHAVQEQMESTVKLLTTRGANVNFIHLGTTALHTAAQMGYSAIFEYLLKGGADIHAGAETAAGTPLHAACTMIDGNPMIQRLIDLGAVIDETDEENQTPLHIAALYGKPANLKLLIDNGANIEARDGRGRTPALIMSFEEQRKECLRVLIKHGADVNVAGHDGRTPLYLAAGDETLEDFVPELLEAGAAVDVAVDDGYTPLHQAVYFKCTKAIKALAEHGVNTEAMNTEGETPRMIAERGGLSGWWRENIPPSREWWRVSSVKLAA